MANATIAIVKLMERYRPMEIETIRKSRRHPEGKVTKTRPATVLQRRPQNQDGSPALATIAELIDTFVTAKGLQFNLQDGETPVGYAFRQAEKDGKIVLKRDKDGNIVTREKSDVPSAAWLAQDAPIRKRRTKGEAAAQRQNALLGQLEDLDLLDDDDSDDDDEQADDATA